MPAEGRQPRAAASAESRVGGETPKPWSAQVIIANLGRLFGGMRIVSASCFRATRNADVVRNEEEAEDLLDMMNDEVRSRGPESTPRGCGVSPRPRS